MIKKYSQLCMAATDEENIRRWLLEFEKRSKKQGLFFDEEEVRKNLLRWLRENRRKNTDIEKNVLNYKSVEELESAMEDCRTKEEEEGNFIDLAKQGIEPPIWENNEYSLFEVRNGEAFSYISNNGTSWCTKDIDTAYEQMQEKGRVVIFAEDGKPLAAIFVDYDQVYWKTDSELVSLDEGDTGVTDEEYQEFLNTYITPEQFENLQKALSFLEKPLLKKEPQI